MLHFLCSGKRTPLWKKDFCHIVNLENLMYLCAITQKTTAMKYPIGIQSFDQIIEGGFVYVDKTDAIFETNIKFRYYGKKS